MRSISAASVQRNHLPTSLEEWRRATSAPYFRPMDMVDIDTSYMRWRTAAVANSNYEQAQGALRAFQRSVHEHGPNVGSERLAKVQSYLPTMRQRTEALAPPPAPDALSGPPPAYNHGPQAAANAGVLATPSEAPPSYDETCKEPSNPKSR